MNPSDNTVKEKHEDTDPAKDQNEETKENNTQAAVGRRNVRLLWHNSEEQKRQLQRRQTVSYERPSKFLNMQVFHLPKHLGRPTPTLSRTGESFRYSLNEAATTTQMPKDENRLALFQLKPNLESNGEQREAAASAQPQEEDNVVYIREHDVETETETETEEPQVVNIMDDQQIANELVRDMQSSQKEEEDETKEEVKVEQPNQIFGEDFNAQEIEMIKQAITCSSLEEQHAAAAEESSAQKHYHTRENSAKSFLVPMAPRPIPRRRHSICEPGRSALNSSAFCHLPNFSAFNMVNRIVPALPPPINLNAINEQQMINRQIANNMHNYAEILELSEHDPVENVQPAYLNKENMKEEANEQDENEYLNDDTTMGSYRKRRSQRSSSLDKHSSRKRHLSARYASPHSCNSSSSNSSSERYNSRSRSRHRFPRSPTPARARTPARPHTPPLPAPIQKDDYIPLLIYDQSLVSGGIFTSKARKVQRAFNRALAAAIVLDNEEFYHGFQLYDTEFKSNFFTFAVNAKKYISPLREIVDGIPALWRNCKLGLMQKGKTTNFVSVVCEIAMRGGSIDFNMFLKIIQKQNPDIDFNTWGLYEQVNTKKKIFMILRMEASMWRLLKVRIIYFLSSTLEFHLRGEIAGFQKPEGIDELHEEASLRNEFENDASTSGGEGEGDGDEYAYNDEEMEEEHEEHGLAQENELIKNENRH